MKIYKVYETVISGIDQNGYNIETENTFGYYLHRETAEYTKKVLLSIYGTYKIKELNVETSKVVVDIEHMEHTYENRED